jgi:hypothetical protein
VQVRVLPAELSADVVLVQHGADRGGEYQASALPQIPHLEAFGRLSGLALPQGSQGEFWKLEDAP